jgi:hypothetical protein
MDFQDAVHRIFPDASLPPELGRGDFVELSGLPARTVPCNCEVLASGQFQYAFGERQHRSYLVRTGTLELMVRLCPDARNSLSAQVALRKPARETTPFH